MGGGEHFVPHEQPDPDNKFVGTPQPPVDFQGKARAVAHAHTFLLTHSPHFSHYPHRYTGGRAVLAVGSPQPPVEFQGKARAGTVQWHRPTHSLTHFTLSHTAYIGTPAGVQSWRWAAPSRPSSFRARRTQWRRPTTCTSS